MKFQPIIACTLCLALAASGAAQTRVAVGAARTSPGISVVPALGMTPSFAPSLNNTLLAPSLTVGLSAVPTPALSVPILPAVAIPSLVPVAAAKAVEPLALAGVKPVAPANNEPPSVSAVAIRTEGEAFWSGSAAKRDFDDSIPVVVPSETRSPSPLARGALALAPMTAALPSLPHWVAAALPYAEGAGAMAGAYALIRVSRLAIDKLAPRFGWDRNAVVMARFISSVVLWTAGAGAGLALLGVSGTALLATVGAGGTAVALAITLAVRDVAGNLFHGVHFLLSRPFTVGDKVTIGKTTGVVSDLTLRYLVLKDENGGFILYTYNSIATAAVKLYGEYKTKEIRLSLSAATFPRGLLRALRDAASPTLWKPILFAALAITALSLFPMLAVGIKASAWSWLAVVLPYLKAGVVAFLTASISRSFKAGLERLAARYNWTRPATTVAKLGAAVLTWIVGGSFLLNAVGVSWAWVAGTLSLSTVLVSIAVNDYVSAVFQGALVLTLKPFQIGDRVTIGDNEGVVIDITLQHVVLKLDGESFMLIPHSVVKDSAILTPREYGQRRK